MTAPLSTIQTAPEAPVAGLLLAGGQGTRMGGLDKGLVDWRGRPMAGWVHDALASAVSPVLISANRSLEVYEGLAPGRVITDAPVHRGQGPLAGLLRGLEETERLGVAALLVCPCDTPEITPDTLRRLLAAWRSAPERPVVAESEGRQHPLHGVYPVSVREALATWLNSGERRVMRFAESVGAAVLDCPGASAAFRNRNRPEDLGPGKTGR
ncbi:molybdenum cofactor guanylyltransferase MobA [Marinobacter sp. C2H3]|uniref:molybdenum cofactor guanylyltransferase MobA n=1 Tax=Marinobacter sp. C2H3 TaxID=3119003 RepID=UPI00300F3E89